MSDPNTRLGQPHAGGRRLKNTRCIDPQETFRQGTRVPYEEWQTAANTGAGTGRRIPLEKHSIAQGIPPCAVQLQDVARLEIGNDTQTAIHVTWCYQASDIKTLADKKDPLTAVALSFLGDQGEICSTQIQGYSDIQRLANSAPAIVVFHPTETRLVPMLDGQCWSRRDIVFGYRPAQGGMTLQLQSTIATVCFDRCRQRGMYSASEDTLRFCDSCNKWFHLDCLTTVIDHADVDWFDPATVHKSALWLPPLDRSLLADVSFEMVLLAARRYYLEHVNSGADDMFPDARQFI
ncbi:hypothetical protein LXA43DRAFT_1069734 [Ganoderma leucocontextum]|nr:hypothetical protein LXA43DRAFT_1069734 [Ganoderma leucocontextum]